MTLIGAFIKTYQLNIGEINIGTPRGWLDEQTRIFGEKLTSLVADVQQEIAMLVKKTMEHTIEDQVNPNRKRVLVVIGATGAGKSTLCNVLGGKHRNDSTFPVSHGLSSNAFKITVETLKWLGDGHDVTLIDTPGLNDPKREDEDAMEAVMEELQNFKQVDGFLFVFNGKDARLSDSQQEMLKIFHKKFGPAFMMNTVIVFSNWHFDLASQDRRRNNSEEERKLDVIANLRELHLLDEDKEIPTVFVDSHQHARDLNEKAAFDREVDKLNKIVQSFGPYKCIEVEKRKQNFLDAFGPGDPEEVCDKLYQVFPHKDGSFFMSVSEAGVATMSAWVRNRDEILRNGKFNQEGHDYMWGYSKPGLPDKDANDMFRLITANDWNQAATVESVADDIKEVLNGSQMDWSVIHVTKGSAPATKGRGPKWFQAQKGAFNLNVLFP